MSEHIIEFDKVNKWYGNNFHVLRDIDLQVRTGERIVICGPSGSATPNSRSWIMRWWPGHTNTRLDSFVGPPSAQP